jgi:hypothetical protein
VEATVTTHPLKNILSFSKMLHNADEFGGDSHENIDGEFVVHYEVCPKLALPRTSGAG